MQDVAASAMLASRVGAQSLAEHPLSAARSRRRRAGTSRIEGRALAALDLAVVAVLSTVAGRGWQVTAVWALSIAAAFAAAGLYRRRLTFSVLDDLPRLLIASSPVVAVSVWLSPVTVGAVATFLGCVAVARALAYSTLYRLRRRRPGEPTLIVGSGDVGVRMAEALIADRGYGLSPIGFVGLPFIDEESPAPLLGSVDDVDEVIDRYRPRGVIVTFAALPDADLVGVLRRCRQMRISVYVVPRLFELGVGRTGAELVHGMPLVRMHPEPPRRLRTVVKRAIDVTGAAVGLACLAPVLAACALAVRWESGRSGVVFRQERVGRGGKLFTILKFRSMTPSSEQESRVRWNIRDDNRVGPVGRILRGTSLDELPQLFNVLRGDMSLVGPRPERPYFVEQFQRTYEGYRDRHRVPVGITGWAQIHGLRGDTSIEDRVRFDNYYAENWSLALDLKILLRTVGSMVSIRRR
jgi:exopolysaccharide biosynthesis polyprenyl glycosylphosphotransferase